MSKSKSIRRAAFHHSEAVTQFLERPWLSGKWPVSKMFHSDTAVLLRSCPRMILVSAMNRGEQAHDLSHEIRDHLQTILEGTPSLLR